jgi:hypothetical protein
MKNDSFIRILLIVIAVLLGLNVILPRVTHPAVSFAKNSTEYKVDRIGVLFDLKTNDLEKMLNKYSKEGWEPIDINYVLTQNKGLIAYVVFKK